MTYKFFSPIFSNVLTFRELTLNLKTEKSAHGYCCLPNEQIQLNCLTLSRDLKIREM